MNYLQTTSLTDQKISLNQLLSKLLPGFQQLAVDRKSFFINDVPRNILVNTDNNIVASVLADLLRIVSSKADNSCIRISAKSFHDVILIHVKDNNGCNNYVLDANFFQVQPLADKIGGFIDVTSQRKKATTIAFSFSNLPKQAA